jgi:triacylglycerol lipase
MPHHRVFLIPGFFGFVDLGDLAYWGPAHAALTAHLGAALRAVALHVVPVPPTASLRARSRVLIDTIERFASPDDPLYLIGHSSGGLDARLLATPGVKLCETDRAEAIASRILAIVTVATPHRGTPSAELFASASGKRLLRLFSVATAYAVRRGPLPLRVLLRLAQAAQRAVNVLPGQRELGLDDHLFDALLSEFSSDRRDAVRAFLGDVGADQGLLSQIAPHAMDLFDATAPDRPGVAYGCVVTRARRPGARGVLRRGLSPIEHGVAALYAACWVMASRLGDDHVPTLTEPQVAALRRAYGVAPTARDNDGMVPTLSQVHGDVIAAAEADHLDILGHYPDPEASPPRYDWLTSGSGFRRPKFDATWAEVARFVASAAMADGRLR